MAAIAQPSMWWVSHAHVKILSKENLHCWVDCAVGKYCLCEKDKEREEKKRKKIGGEVGRTGKKKITSVSYGGIYVLGWSIKRAGACSWCVHVCCCKEISWFEFLGS